MHKTVFFIICLLLVGQLGLGSANANPGSNELRSLIGRHNPIAKDYFQCKAIEDRIELHRQMAEDYFKGYDQETVEEGAAYASWTVAEGAEYWSPYFTNFETIPLVSMEDIALSATIEANAYRVRFTDWGPVEFMSWPSDHGFVMRTKFEGTDRCTGNVMSFYTHGFVETNEDGEITHWETWPDSRPYDNFLKTAIGKCGPWKDAAEYYGAIIEFLENAATFECPASE